MLIEAKPGGGDWSDPDTWIGGVVPGEGDDVVIRGMTSPVVIGDGVSTTINTLTVDGGYAVATPTNPDMTFRGPVNRLVGGGTVTLTGSFTDRASDRQWFQVEDEMDGTVFDVDLPEDVSEAVRQFYGSGDLGIDFAQMLASFLACQGGGTAGTHPDRPGWVLVRKDSTVDRERFLDAVAYGAVLVEQSFNTANAATAHRILREVAARTLGVEAS